MPTHTTHHLALSLEPGVQIFVHTPWTRHITPSCPCPAAAHSLQCAFAARTVKREVLQASSGRIAAQSSITCPSGYLATAASAFAGLCCRALLRGHGFAATVVGTVRCPSGRFSEAGLRRSLEEDRLQSRSAVSDSRWEWVV